MPARRDATNTSQRDAKKKSYRTGTTAGLLAAIIALLHTAIGVELAGAGTYAIRNCNVPGHPAAPLHPWVAADNPGSGASLVDTCATGEGVAFALGDTRQLQGNAQIMVQQPIAPRSQIKFVKAAVWYAARLAGSGTPIIFFTSYVLPDWTGGFGPSTSPPGSENMLAEVQLSPETASFYAGIHCPLSATCVAADSVPLLIRGMELTLREDVPPTVSRPSGALLDGGSQSGTRTLTYSASDPHSGLSKVEVLLGDTVVASHDLTPQCSYSDFTACPATLDEALQVDTRLVNNGAHRLTLRVEDAAGNERTVDGGHVVDVANEASAAAADGPLSIKFDATSGSTLVVPYGRRVTVQGRLAQGSQPVAAGTVIELLERPEGNRTREEVTRRVQTKGNGSFSVRLSTTRPSRTLHMAYRPTADSQVVSRTLKLRVRAASRVRASLRGRLVRFSGRVVSRPVPRAGKRIVMEGRSPGSAWTAFRTMRTNRDGRFSGTYRLRVLRPGVTLKVRANVPRETGYGYLGSHSRTVTFRVR